MTLYSISNLRSDQTSLKPEALLPDLTPGDGEYARKLNCCQTEQFFQSSGHYIFGPILFQSYTKQTYIINNASGISTSEELSQL
jgi:hypothetical protein